MDLFELQREFCARLADRNAEWPAAALFTNTQGFQVYRHAYRAQLTACLRDTYSKTCAWLGDTAFDRAARHHIELNPSSSWTLGNFGANFTLTLANRYPDDPEIAELAWLEWALRKAFDGADAVERSIADAPVTDWERATLRLVPTLYVRSIQTNCAAIWAAIEQGNAPPAASVLPKIAGLRVWRKHLTAQFRSIDAAERHALGLARARAPLGDICASLLVHYPEDEATVVAGEMLAAWSRDGLIAAIENDHAVAGVRTS